MAVQITDEVRQIANGKRDTAAFDWTDWLDGDEKLETVTVSGPTELGAGNPQVNANDYFDSLRKKTVKAGYAALCSVKTTAPGVYTLTFEITTTTGREDAKFVNIEAV